MRPKFESNIIIPRVPRYYSVPLLLVLYTNLFLSNFLFIFNTKTNLFFVFLIIEKGPRNERTNEQRVCKEKRHRVPPSTVCTHSQYSDILRALLHAFFCSLSFSPLCPPKVFFFNLLSILFSFFMRKMANKYLHFFPQWEQAVFNHHCGGGATHMG
jgi:hypothetical protein